MTLRGAAAALALALPAAAAPPDARLALHAKAPRIEKLGAGWDAALAVPEGIVRAEILATGELLLEPLAPGEARVFVFSQRLVRVVEVAVDRPLEPPGAAPPPACSRGADARVASEPCYRAWRERLQRLPAAEAPHLVLEDDGLLAESRAAAAALKAAGLAKVSVAIGPFGVLVKGARDEAELRQSLVAVWPAVLGPLRIDR